MPTLPTRRLHRIVWSLLVSIAILWPGVSFMQPMAQRCRQSGARGIEQSTSFLQRGKTLFWILLSLSCPLLTCAAAEVQDAAAPLAADRILRNAKIWTVNKHQPQAEALAIRGERIVAVGSDAEVLKLAGPGTDAAFHETQCGSLEVGKLADLAVLSRDILADSEREYSPRGLNSGWLRRRGRRWLNRYTIGTIYPSRGWRR